MLAFVASEEEKPLCLSRPDEIIEIEDWYRKLGFPGCIGRVDCAGWEWDLCPVERQGL